MFANVFTKATRDRFPGGLIGAGSIGLLLIFAVWVYQDVDTSFYYELPRTVLDLMGIDPDGSGVAAMAFGAMYSFMGAIAVAGFAIAIGGAAIAGEEVDGTLGLLLGNPVSRRKVLASKAASLVLIVAVMGAVLWASAGVAAALFDVDTGGLFVGSMVVALTLNALFHGSVALAVGSWTGKRSAALGVATGVMIVGYLGASLLPIADLERFAQIFPWYYFSAGTPLINGLDVGHVGVLVGLTVAMLVIAWVGVQRRDLREKGTEVTLIDRLRSHPLTSRLAERVAGSVRVTRIATKSLSDFQWLLAITAGVMFYMGVLIAPLFNFIPADFIDVFATFPDALVAMVGGVDMSTPEGFLTGELFSLVGPIAGIVLLAVMGGRALAGEEEDRTMDLLLSNPISRSHIVLEKALAMVGNAALFGVTTFAGTLVGVRIAGLDQVGIVGIASISAMLAVFGLAMGGVALAASAASGRVRVATWSTVGVALASWFVFSFFPLADSFEPWAVASPFTWYLGNDPLLNGMDWTGAALLSAMFVVLVGAAVRLFEHRDLRG